MKKTRAIQKITKGEQVFMPGEFIDDNFTDKELKEYIETGFAVVKTVVEKKPKSKKKVKDVKQNP